ncbi:MAG: DUF3089 domain-containing protein [Pseudomonadales bacterium]
MKRFVAMVLLLVGANGALGADAIDYGDPDTWLCRPDHPNACAVGLDATVVRANGSVSEAPYVADADPSIDCFYVYPTVSNDPTGNSDMQAGPEEMRVIQAQFARFGAACRTFAPLYRQVTLTALRARFSGQSIDADRALGYGDVKAAWDYYLAHDNDGRGVVLIGHSQGSGVLTALIAQEIDGKPVQSRIVSALLIGTSSVVNPPGEDVGGTFQNMPLCRAADQTQCIVTFASFRSTIPPPERSLFGRIREDGGVPACNNPASLAGGSAVMDAYLASGGENIASGSDSRQWVTPAVEIGTPFVNPTGLLSAECVNKGGFAYLEVTVNGDPDDPRADDIAGDVVIEGQVNAGWGLHLIDMHLAMGDLVNLVRTQGAAHLAR